MNATGAISRNLWKAIAAVALVAVTLGISTAVFQAAGGRDVRFEPGDRVVYVGTFDPTPVHGVIVRQDYDTEREIYQVRIAGGKVVHVDAEYLTHEPQTAEPKP